MKTPVLLAAMAACLAGCLPYTQSTVTTVDQTAYVPPPSGFLVEGPLVREYGAGVQGSVDYAFTQKSGARADGASGHAVLDGGLTLAGMYGAKTFFELGLGGDLPHEKLSTTTSSDGSLDTGTRNRTSVWVEPYVRFDLNPGKPDAIDVIVFASVDGGEVRYIRRVSEHTVTQIYNPIDNQEFRSTQAYSVEVNEGKAMILRPKAGLNVVIPLDPAIGVSLAAMVQSQPNFFGQAKVVRHCSSSGFGTGRSCVGEDESDLDVYDSDIMVTVGSGIAVDVDPAVVIVKGWFNVLGATEWMRDAPGGVSLDLRFNL